MSPLFVKIMERLLIAIVLALGVLAVSNAYFMLCDGLPPTCSDIGCNSTPEPNLETE